MKHYKERRPVTAIFLNRLNGNDIVVYTEQYDGSMTYQ